MIILDSIRSQLKQRVKRGTPLFFILTRINRCLYAGQKALYRYHLWRTAGAKNNFFFIQIGANEAKLAPLELKLSETMRLRRLSRGAKYKEDARQLVVPLPRRTDPAAHLVGFLRDLVVE